MKNTLYTVCFMFIISSCIDKNTNNTISKKDINKDKIIQTDESARELFEQYDIIAGKFLAEYASTSKSHFLDSAFVYFNKCRSQVPHEAFPSISCGMISEKLGQKVVANKFYKEAYKIAKQNISNPIPVMEYEFGTSNVKELAKSMNLGEDEIIKGINDSQMFYLLQSKILLKENSQDDFKIFKEIASSSNNKFISQHKNVTKREDIFKLIEGN